MILYFAPLEGLTDAIYRKVHHDTFAGVSKYFMPFISPSRSLSFTLRQRSDLSPAQNASVPAVPQILARDPECFLGAANMLRDAGYPEVNLNLGCPSGTVTAKGKGAGMLRDRDALARFLDAIYARSPLPVSIKTRVGYESIQEWPALFSLFCQYPVRELILHPRTCREFYSGAPHRELFRDALEKAPFPLVYNGDIFTQAEGVAFCRQHPGAGALMLGRGMAANPALAQAILGGQKLTLSSLRDFHDRLYAAYCRAWPESAAVGRMHGIMHYLLFAFEDAEKPARAIRKSTTPDAYSDAVGQLFSQCRLKDVPLFIPPGS